MVSSDSRPHGLRISRDWSAGSNPAALSQSLVGSYSALRIGRILDSVAMGFSLVGGSKAILRATGGAGSENLVIGFWRSSLAMGRRIL